MWFAWIDSSVCIYSMVLVGVHLKLCCLVLMKSEELGSVAFPPRGWSGGVRARAPKSSVARKEEEKEHKMRRSSRGGIKLRATRTKRIVRKCGSPTD
jgi:hypothetical protein